MKSYQYILLDWDGNLAKTLDIWLHACRIPLEKRGVKLTDEEIASSFGQYKNFIGEWGLANEADAIIQETDSIARKKLPDVELYPGALFVLETLKENGKKLALITTSPHLNITHLLEKYDMIRLFDAIVAADDTTKHKPHPEPLEKGLELMGGSKESAIMVGDSDKDLGAAQNAGIDSILFYPEEHKKFYPIETLSKHNPTYIIDDFKKMLDIVGI